ncbi:MAG TPA: hypothetical protein VFH74_01395 [Gaiellales bacterium]|nr:hypothetical protein [Gaiellales bacterium]
MQFEPSEQAKRQAANLMVAIARDVLPADEVAAVDAMDRDEVDRALADQIRHMKDQQPGQFEALLEMLPAGNRAYMQDIAQRYSL